ncbi:DNA-binding protein [Sulfolobus sp. E5-1-F]|uniref:DNA-binding protein n=1 Tax=Saccharolobus sp. E5-1-F TaxID=2663019 RepID=UPI0012948F6D|nr:DNA-binding protein [Sulfolobus sp. E5-1-F]QGA53981.1 DNA-binding protein [Sulfolobus sp. E5-1-F]
MIAIADTSFLIDWVRYSKRDLIFHIFDLVYVPESVFNEVRSERTLLWIAQGLESNKLAIFPELPQIRDEALRLVYETRRLPLRPVDYPEAYCVVVGKVLRYTVLTENGGAVALVNYYKEYMDVKVMRALEVLVELHRNGLVTDIRNEIKEYSRETGHMFSNKDLSYYGLI